MLTHENLDKRICDCEDCENTQTYREYIRESEKEIGMCEAPLDEFDNITLDGYLEFIDYLWEK